MIDIQKEIKRLGLRDYEHYLLYKEFKRITERIEKNNK